MILLNLRKCNEIKNVIDSLNKIYIIRNDTDPLSLKSRINFYRQQKLLESFGYEILNPIERIDNYSLKVGFECKKFNLKTLIECTAVFIMEDVSLKRGDNVELQISIDLGLMIIQNFIVDID